MLMLCVRACMQAIVAAIQANNPGRPIPNARVMGFASRPDANAFMLGLEDKVQGALHFAVASATSIGFTIQANTTARTSPAPAACHFC
jgi:hypothetical protein